MKKIGIVGAENSHSAAIAKIINIDKSIPEYTVSVIWGETREFAENSAEKGNIPKIVDDPGDMISEVDAAIVDHRHAGEHLDAALPFLEAGKPLFIDKPFCYRLHRGKEFLEKAEERAVPVCSFSVVPKQNDFLKFKEKSEICKPFSAVVTTGPCDIESEYGGIFFYGIHQVDMILRLVGYDVGSVTVNRGGDNSTATIFFKSGTVATMNLLKDSSSGWHISAIGQELRHDSSINYNDNIYLQGVKDFTNMFETGSTMETKQTILAPVAVLEAMEESIEQDGTEVEVDAV